MQQQQQQQQKQPTIAATQPPPLTSTTNKSTVASKLFAGVFGALVVALVGFLIWFFYFRIPPFTGYTPS